MASAETLKGVTFEGLIAGPEIPLMTKNVTLATGQKVTRGTLLTLDDTAGTYSATASGGKASAIAAEDFEATEASAVATVYTSGYFNRDALTVAEGDDVTKHEEELRALNIYLSKQH